MVSIAKEMLKKEWKKYLPAMLAIAFSGLLMIVQIGLMLGMFSTVTMIVDNSSADLFVTHPQTESPDMAREMPALLEWRLMSHPAVQDVQTVTMSYGDWRKPDGGKTMAYIIGFDTSPDTLGMPTPFSDNLRRALLEPGAVVVDEADLHKLNVEPGETAELNNKRVKLVGTVRGFRNLMGSNVFMSTQTARQVDFFSLYGGEQYAQFFLVKTDDRWPIDFVAKDLQSMTDQSEFKVWHPEEFSNHSHWFWLMESGSGVSIGFSALLAVIVGISITSQTLRGAVLASLKEFAMLRAMGIPVKSLQAIVMEQSLWLGVAGFYTTVIFTLLCAWLAQEAHVAVSFPMWTWVVTGLFTLVVAAASGLASLRTLYRTQPEELLK